MIKLKKVEISKFKNFLKPQEIAIEPDITTIVGMNESGKTSFLTALAKTNYFITDPDFTFDIVQDYPRKELIDFQDSGNDSQILKCTYELSADIIAKIKDELGVEIKSNEITYAYFYKEKDTIVSGLETDLELFLATRCNDYKISEERKDEILRIGNFSQILELESIENETGFEKLKTDLTRILSLGHQKPVWKNPLDSYIEKSIISPKLPKFWYFDDYYPLPGKININKLQRKEVYSESEKTSNALFELARIKPQDILNAGSQDYEKYIALLEASSNKITAEIFKYWSTNKNLDIEFKIQEITNEQGQNNKLLDIRVKNQRHKITLPLDRRSKGFNWFFSFIIWFSKIQADKNSDFILLLDEPGLNLHASAQEDLLNFFSDLSSKYQIIYTTHSPFMIESDKLNHVRTCLDSEEGAILSESIQEKDPNTLFPLQAALGYSIAQNLFIGKNNLIVEGAADLLYISVISSLLEQNKKTFLNPEINIVPVGGLDKVTTFISLLRGSKLNIVCLLDTFTDQKGKQRVDDLIKEKIIKEKNIHFFNEYSNNGKSIADIEDLFTKEDYLKLFNLSFLGDYSELKVSDLDQSLDTIVKQINKAIGKERYNHYRPALKLSQLGVDISFLNPTSLDNFEKMFNTINKLFN